ncbi:MAG: DnaJ domain-containing protein [Spirochaetales bacterium]|nr:DnaJ domain-containing protein [Spirochaetales bacterium]
MDQIFDRLTNLFRTLFTEDPFDSDAYKETRNRYYDPDLQDAWDELDDFLNEGKSDSSTSYKQKKTDTHYIDPALEALKKDYANLEVEFQAPFSEVKKSYKKLLTKYHPDRFANNPKKLKIATEISKKINQSFQLIRDYEKKRGNTK